MTNLTESSGSLPQPMSNMNSGVVLLPNNAFKGRRAKRASPNASVRPSDRTMTPLMPKRTVWMKWVLPYGLVLVVFAWTFYNKAA